MKREPGLYEGAYLGAEWLAQETWRQVKRLFKAQPGKPHSFHQADMKRNEHNQRVEQTLARQKKGETK